MIRDALIEVGGQALGLVLLVGTLAGLHVLIDPRITAQRRANALARARRRAIERERAALRSAITNGGR